ncbi:MAG: type II secretion system protein GspD [Acidithiobacillus sp.]
MRKPHHHPLIQAIAMPTPKLVRWCVAMAIGMGLAGCAHPTLHSVQAAQRAEMAKTRSAPDTFQWNSQGIYINRRAVNYHPGAGSVSITVHQAPVGSALARLVALHHYSLFFSGSATPDTKITANIADSSLISAVRQMAQAAGYCAIIHPNARRIIIATHGTYYFHVPTTLLVAGKASYDVGGDPAAQGGESGGSSGGMGGGMAGGMGGGMAGGGAGMSGGSSSGSSGSMSANFIISGKTKEEKSGTLLKNIKAVAGDGSQVSINGTTGMIAVTADATGLGRAENFIREYVRLVDTSVSLHVAILQVSLNNGLQYGINWSKIVQIAGNQTLNFAFPNNAPAAINAAVSGNSGSTSTGSTSVTYTGQNISSVIQALSSITNTRVISEPYITAENNTPATLFSGKQIPYIGDVSSNITGLSGTSSTGAGFQYVLDGLSLSFVPDILNNHLVSIKILPALSQVNQFVSATVDGTQLQGPVQDLKQTFLQSTIPNGKTLIIGGARQNSAIDENSETPGLGKIPVLGYLFKGINNQGNTSQLVILVHADINRAPDYNPLIGESL